MFLDAIRQEDGVMRVTLGGPAKSREGDTVYTRFLIGADGTHSKVAQCLGLDRNTHFLAGVEWLVKGGPVDPETFYIVMTHQLAPASCIWLAPHADIAAGCVAGLPPAFRSIS